MPPPSPPTVDPDQDRVRDVAYELIYRRVPETLPSFIFLACTAMDEIELSQEVLAPLRNRKSILEAQKRCWWWCCWCCPCVDTLDVLLERDTKEVRYHERRIEHMRLITMACSFSEIATDECVALMKVVLKKLERALAELNESS